MYIRTYRRDMSRAQIRIKAFAGISFMVQEISIGEHSHYLFEEKRYRFIFKRIVKYEYVLNLPAVSALSGHHPDNGREREPLTCTDPVLPSCFVHTRIFNSHKIMTSNQKMSSLYIVSDNVKQCPPFTTSIAMFS